MGKILIIDDEPQLRTVLRDILVKEGIAVQEASDGRAGLALWRQCPVDVVLSRALLTSVTGRRNP